MTSTLDQKVEQLAETLLRKERHLFDTAFSDGYLMAGLTKVLREGLVEVFLPTAEELYDTEKAKFKALYSMGTISYGVK